MSVPSEKRLRELAREGNVVPLSRRIPADLDTPVSAFLKLAAKKKRAFLLESIEGGEQLARYSFLGFDPFLTVRVAPPRSGLTAGAPEVEISEGRSRRVIGGSPLHILNELLAEFRPVAATDIPRFSGGAVGYFSYDAFRWFERVADTNPDTIGMPDCVLDFYQSVVVFDHLKQEIILISNVLTERGAGSLREKRRRAVTWLDRAQRALEEPLKRTQRAQPPQRKASLVAETSRSDFERSVRAAKRYIKEGDIFQVVLSQRWSARLALAPLEIYRRLRRINPSPYMFLLKCNESSVVGSSPEMLARIENGFIDTRPIAGTRPRGADAAEDVALAAELLADPKEAAEHTMLLDLGRNDIGRVSRPGGVRVTRNMEVEKYSHVMHLVSAVQGDIRPEVTALEGLFSCFPAGTVTGAPKIRAMEIIEELEPSRRGAYAGAVAYLDFWGALDSCIAIRTIVQHRDRIFLQAGAGIVADSRPVKEFQETEHKARALYEALTG
ncbi:MAG TPA: anthranilate synthase component I [candidate division Zixibacteria bacterium]|nr:anthranilate synthase component I [candidate division Zixibacteria bacterium]